MGAPPPRSVMREADAVVFNTPGAADFLRLYYAEYADKIKTITNGYDPECFVQNLVPPLSRPTIDLVHTGEIYANRAPGPLLDAVEGLDSAALGGRSSPGAPSGEHPAGRTEKANRGQDRQRLGGLGFSRRSCVVQSIVTRHG